MFGTNADTTTTKANGVIHVGILYVAMVKYGFVLYVRTASMPTSRKNQTLAPMTPTLEWKTNFEERTYSAAGKVEKAVDGNANAWVSRRHIYMAR